MTATGARPISEVGQPLTGAGRYLDVGSRFDARAAALVVLSFLPYAAIPVGNNTNFPLAALVSVLYLRDLLARPRLLGAVLVVSGTPLVMFFLQNLLGHGHGNVRGIVSWTVLVAPFAAAACAVVTALATVVLTLRVMLAASAAYTLVQMYFLRQGSIPLLSWYEMPGYWSVPENAEVIVTYIRRPFGWFPEPSFMAGTLALGLVALFLLGVAVNRRVARIDLSIAVLVVAAMFFGRSGSTLITIPALAALALLPFSTRLRKLAFAALGLGGSLVLGVRLLSARNETNNFSWDDRATSIIAGMRYLLESPMNLLLGAGRGGATVLYTQGSISTEGLPLSVPLADIFSVSGRVIMENGVLGGAVIVVVLLVPILLAHGAFMSWPMSAAAAAVWLTVVTLTITYDSAAWLWMLPGVCLGLVQHLQPGRRSLEPASGARAPHPSVPTSDGRTIAG